MRVAIVDDDPITVESLRAMLADEGHTVLRVSPPTDLVKVLSRGEASVVICDWEMPEIQGPDLCRKVRDADLPLYPYIILLTGRRDPTHASEALRAGADDFLMKPVTKSDLLARLHVARRFLAVETRDMAIFALAKLAESRDPETGAHLDRIRHYSRLLAEGLAVSRAFGDAITPEFVRLIYQTSPLHDIGKVGIPDAILLKPGRLTEDEFEVMKTHTVVGSATLEAIVREYPDVSYLRMARDIARSHHERFDGMGYPDGLVGDAIPLAARIVAVADVYDALVSKRVYKEAGSHEDACATVINESHRHFDPRVVKAFCTWEEQFKAIHDQFAEPSRAATSAYVGRDSWLG